MNHIVLVVSSNKALHNDINIMTVKEDYSLTDANMMIHAQLNPPTAFEDDYSMNCYHSYSFEEITKTSPEIKTQLKLYTPIYKYF